MPMDRCQCRGCLLPVICLIILSLLLFSCERSNSQDFNSVEARIKEILDLPAYEYVYRNIVYAGEEKKFLKLIPTQDTQVLFSIDIRVQAGINLQRGIELLSGNSGDITVILPRAEILLVDADESSIHQYYIQERGGEIMRLEYYDEIDRQKAALKEDAADRGILYKAEENSEKLLRNFLKLAGFTEILFIWRNPEKEPAE